GRGPSRLAYPGLKMSDKPSTSTRKSPLDLLRPAVRAMPGYTPGEQIADLTKLNTNEGAFPPSPRVRAALGAIADESLRLYPDPTASGLRAVAAARYGVSPDEVLAGNGSDDCLTILYRGFLDPGERVACPWPTYGLYSTLAALQGAELVRRPFVVEGRRFVLPSDLTAQRAKMIILANPNNPTATLVPVDTQRALCDQAREAIVVVDEAYVDFALGAGIDASMLPSLGQHENGRPAHDVQELQPGGRAPRPPVRRRADRRGADQGQGQLQRQCRHPGDRHRRA